MTSALCLKITDFNPRTHEECDGFIDRRKRVANYFNPRTHEECDIAIKNYLMRRPISIHALTRSATANYSDNQ